MSLSSLIFPLAPNMKHINTTPRRPIKIRLLRINIPIQPWINSPLDDLKRRIEARRKAIADGVVEVIAEDEVVAVYAFLGCEREGDTVLVVGFGVCREGEVRGCARRGAREAAVVLGLLEGLGWLRCRRGGRRTCIRTFRLTSIRSLEIEIGVALLTGTI
jgi:hypothetical protein